MIDLTPAGVAPPPCGIVVAIGAGRMTRLPCKQKTCSSCGPRWRSSRHLHFARVLATAGPLTYLEVSRQAWTRVRSRVREYSYLRAPISADRFTIITTAPVGEPVDDLDTLLADLFAEDMFVGGRVTASKGWRTLTEEIDTSRVVERWAKVTILDRARAAS